MKELACGSDNTASGTRQETQVQSLGWEDPLEKEMAPHSRTLAWKIPWMEEPGRLQSMGLQRVRHDFSLSVSLSLSFSLSIYRSERSEVAQSCPTLCDPRGL